MLAIYMYIYIYVELVFRCGIFCVVGVMDSCRY
jgi:hypothetical protein